MCLSALALNLQTNNLNYQMNWSSVKSTIFASNM